MITYCFLLILFSIGVTPKTLPPDIKKCRISDPDLNKCLEEVVPEAVLKFKPGNKDLGVVPLEPLFVEKADLGEVGSSESVKIHQIYSNLKLYGMTNATLFDSDANFTEDNCYWNFKTHAYKIVMEADYTMTGRLLLFPINGHGKCKNVIDDVEARYRVKCERYMKKNKKHIRVISVDFKTIPKRVVYDFENIIDGNEELSKEVLKTLNENALDVYVEVGPVFDKVLGNLYEHILHQVFSRVPEEELFLP